MSLIAEGADPTEAVQRLSTAAQARTSLFAAAGLDPRPSSPYMPFLIKTTAVVLALVVVIVTSELVVSRALSDLPRRAASFMLATVDQVGQLSQWVSEERKREIGRSLRMALDNLQPVIEEVRPSLLDARPTNEIDPKSSGR